MAYTMKPLPEVPPPPVLGPPNRGSAKTSAKVEVPIETAPEAPIETAPTAPIRSSASAKVRATKGHSFYVPTQRKLLRPNIPTPLILDRWVLNQIKHGLLEIVDA